MICAVSIMQVAASRLITLFFNGIPSFCVAILFQLSYNLSTGGATPSTYERGTQMAKSYDLKDIIKNSTATSNSSNKIVDYKIAFPKYHFPLLKDTLETVRNTVCNLETPNYSVNAANVAIDTVSKVLDNLVNMDVLDNSVRQCLKSVVLQDDRVWISDSDLTLLAKHSNTDIKSNHDSSSGFNWMEQKDFIVSVLNLLLTCIMMLIPQDNKQVNYVQQVIVVQSESQNNDEILKLYENKINVLLEQIQEYETYDAEDHLKLKELLQVPHIDSDKH